MQTKNRRQQVKDRALNAVLDGWSNLCYTDFNVEQDHYIRRDGCRADYSSGNCHGASVHSVQRAGTTSVQAGFVRQQELLRHFKRAQIDLIAAADEG